MIYTLLFYFILIICCFNKSNLRVIVFCSIVIALYLGLRYNYMYDYMGYYTYFYSITSSYNPNEHMEYGWFLLNKLFLPLGFFPFVFFTSCVFSYGIYLTLKDFAIPKYTIIAVLGIVTTSSFCVLSSAQRQMFVTGIFLISFNALIYNRIRKVKDLLSWRTVLYFIIIYLCKYFHNSASFLLIIPLLYLIPQKSSIVVVIMMTLFFLEFFWGHYFIPLIIGRIIEETGSYDFLMTINREYDSVSLVGRLMYVFQMIAIAYTYRYCNLNKNQQVCILLYFVCLLLWMTINHSFQVFRLALYLYVFIYFSIGIFLLKINNKNFRVFVGAVYLAWCIDNALFIFHIQPGSIEEYKTIFSVL